MIEQEQKIVDLNNIITDLRQENAKASSKVVELNEKKASLQSVLLQVEEDAKYKELDLSLAKRKIQHLTEELNVGSPPPMKETEVPSHSSMKRPSFIGLSALDSDYESSVSSEEVIGEPLVTMSPRGKSGTKHFVFEAEVLNYWTVERVEGIEIQPSVPDQPVLDSSSRKDPGQEYFALVSPRQASQAVKLNSPYMDTICTVSTKELYDKAMKNSIPFHKVRTRQWHIWIESQLTNAYLESIYSAQAKKVGMKPRRSGR